MIEAHRLVSTDEPVRLCCVISEILITSFVLSIDDNNTAFDNSLGELVLQKNRKDVSSIRFQVDQNGQCNQNASKSRGLVLSQYVAIVA